MAQFSSTDYTKEIDLSTSLRGEQITYTSKPGIADWDSISPSISLLAEHTDIPSDSKVLILGCGYGVLAAALAKSSPESHFLLMDQSIIAIQMSQKTLISNRIDNVDLSTEISLFPEKSQQFDLVILDLPKGRRLAQRWLVEAFSALQTYGKLYMAGSNNEGIRTVINDAKSLFGNASILGYKKGNRLARLIRLKGVKTQVSWAKKPGITPGTWMSMTVDTPQGHFELISLPGVFSYDRLDPGTRLLLNHMKGTTNKRVLDLGCGYGILGLSCLVDGAKWVDMVDSNLLAVAAAEKNLKAMGYGNAEVLPSDVLSNIPGRSYDLIVSNPPFHAGRKVNYQITNAFLKQGFEALNEDGRMLIVANQFIRYEQIMHQFFRNVTLVAEDGRYQVWQATK